MTKVLLIVAGVILLVILILYNRLIRLRNSVKQAESGIDVYLNQRFDLIPNLVECVKGYSAYEKSTLDNLVEQRTKYVNNQKLDIKEAEKLNKNLNSVLLVAENYPELKASEQYLSLQQSLSKVENQLQAARRIYNMAVTSYNNAVETIPSSIIANLFKFEKAELFKIEEFKKENIDVK